NRDGDGHGHEYGGTHPRGDAARAAPAIFLEAIGGQFLGVARHRFDADLAHQLARAGVVIGMLDPYRRPVVAVAGSRVGKLLVALAVVGTPVGHLGGDAVFGHHRDQAFDIFDSWGRIDAAHDGSLRQLAAVAIRDAAVFQPLFLNRNRPSCAVDATNLPDRSNICPRTRPRAPCAVGLSHAYNSQSSTRNGR